MSSDVTRKLQLSSSCCLLSCSSSRSRAAGRPASRPTGRLASCHRLQRRRQANVPQANPPPCHLATSASSHESRDFIDDTIKHNRLLIAIPYLSLPFLLRITYGNRYVVPVKYVKYDDEEPLPKERKHTVTPFVLPSSTAARSSARPVAPT